MIYRKIISLGLMLAMSCTLIGCAAGAAGTNQTAANETEQVQTADESAAPVDEAQEKAEAAQAAADKAMTAAEAAKADVEAAKAAVEEAQKNLREAEAAAAALGVEDEETEAVEDEALEASDDETLDDAEEGDEAGDEETDESAASETADEADTDSEEDTTDYLAIYVPVIDEYCNYIEQHYSDGKTTDFDGSTGMMDELAGRSEEEVCASVGYDIRDLSGDGIPELTMIDVTPDKYGNVQAEMILAVFTIKNDKPVFVTEGWARNALYMLNDGSLFNLGSNGADSTTIGNAVLSKDGTKLNWREFYFTGLNDGKKAKAITGSPDRGNRTDSEEKEEDVEESGDNIVVFTNRTGEFDAEKSQLTDMNSDDFTKLWDEYEKNIVRFASFTLIGDYMETGYYSGNNAVGFEAEGVETKPYEIKKDETDANAADSDKKEAEVAEDAGAKKGKEAKGSAARGR